MLTVEQIRAFLLGLTQSVSDKLEPILVKYGFK